MFLFGHLSTSENVKYKYKSSKVVTILANILVSFPQLYVCFV